MTREVRGATQGSSSVEIRAAAPTAMPTEVSKRGSSARDSAWGAADCMRADRWAKPATRRQGRGVSAEP